MNKVSLKNTVLPLIILIISSFNLTAQTKELPETDVQRVEVQVKQLLKKPYLTDTGINAPPCSELSDYPNWEKIKLQKCNYVMKKDGSGGTKRATVIVHIPAVNQLARWIVATCKKVKNTTAQTCTDKLLFFITDSSGGQFPVNGIVFEDMDKNKIHNSFNFRDGVTVVIENGIDNGSEVQPSDKQIEISLTGKILKTGPSASARLVGTSREQYISSCKIDKNCLLDIEKIGKTSERKTEWVDVVRVLYQTALVSDENPLMIAWARANKKSL